MDEPLKPAGLTLTAEEFAAVFPFHVAFDRELRVAQFGSKFTRVCPMAKPGGLLSDSLRLKRPELPFTWESIASHPGALFLLEGLESGIALRGQMLPLADGSTLMFLGSPWFTEADAVVRAGLAFDDFAIHDPGMDMLLVMQAQSTALGEVKDLAARLVRQKSELRAEKELLSATLASIADGVITVDARQRVQLLNPAAEALTGWKSSFAAGHLLAEVLVLRDDRDAPVGDLMTDAIVQGRAIGDIHSTEKVITLRSRDDQRRTIVISALPMRDAAGAIHGGLIVFRDVSSELAAEQMKEDFVHAVSHELRTPLTAIRGFIATLQNDPAMPEGTRREFLQIIHDQAARLGQLVDNILEISRIESDGVIYDEQPLQLEDIAVRSLAEIRPQADAKTLRVEASLQPELPSFHGDALRLQSALTNLLANAVKFTPEGGQVRLELGVHNGEIRLAVRDTGLGIPEEHLDRIFQKFYRVPRPGLQIPGTGLGLSIVRGIVEHYGGRIEVESRVGHGSCFRVYLPQNPARNHEAG